MASRPLSENEIDFILAGLSSAANGIPEASQQSLVSLKETQRKELREIRIPDLEEAVILFKNLYVQHYLEALAKPGERVGNRAAESIARNITQIVINSKKGNTGKQTYLSGFDAIKELVTLPEKRKLPESYLYFKPRLGRKNLENRASDYKAIYLSDLVGSNYEQLDRDTLLIPNWYGFFLASHKGALPASENVLRLTLNVALMTEMRITMAQVADALERTEYPATLRVVYSPLFLGIIDIYPIDAGLSEILENKGLTRSDLSLNEKEQLYISAALIPNLDKIQLTGITGLGDIYSNTLYLNRFLEGAVPIGKDLWRVDFSLADTLDAMVSKVDLMELLGMVAIIAEEQPYRDAIIVESVTPPLESIDLNVKDIKRVNKFTHLTATGSNMEALLSRDELDETRVYDNNAREIYRLLGVEATRNFLNRESLRLLRGISSVNVRHTSLLFDYILVHGVLAPISKKGMKIHGVGPFAEATFQEPDEVMTKAAALGLPDNLSSTASAIYVNRAAKIGVGYYTKLKEAEEAKRLSVSEVDQYLGRVKPAEIVPSRIPPSTNRPPVAPIKKVAPAKRTCPVVTGAPLANNPLTRTAAKRILPSLK